MENVVTICGSYRFVEDMYRAYREETEKGKIVLMPAINCNNMTMDKKRELHRKKIELSNEVLIVTRDWYVGEDTKKEIDLAQSLLKTIKMVNYTSGEWRLL